MSAACTPLPAAGRLLAQNVVCSTSQLVRGLRDGGQAGALRALMQARQHWLAELARHVNADRHAGSLTALKAAVAESDRTLEALLV